MLADKFEITIPIHIQRYNNKPIDLSLSFRLASLPPGANLELVQASRSPAVISVGLQLPDNKRIIQKVSSATTLWKILRILETSNKLNMTERALPSTGEGAGRLYYEMPVLNVMNREFGTFEELQKTLAQIGVTSGNVLLRLSYKSSGTPLEEAMQEISKFFKEEAEASGVKQPNQVPDKRAVPLEDSKMDIDEPNQELEPVQELGSTTSTTSKSAPISETLNQLESLTSTSPTTQLSSTTSDPSDTTSVPSLTIYSPPTTSTPLAATMPFQEQDYVPTIEHAQTHQSRLLASTRNTRLPSDKEIAAKQAAKAETISAISSIRVRVRFPDLSVLEAVLSNNNNSASGIYAIVRENMRYPNANFVLRFVDGASGRTKDVPDDNRTDVVKNLGWRGGTLVTFTWADVGASPAAKHEPALKDEVLKVAKKMDIPIQNPENTDENNENNGKGKGSLLGNMMKDISKTASKLTGLEKEDKLKKMLGFGKKKK